MNYTDWHLPEPNPDRSKPTLVVYSSCYTYQILTYLEKARPEIRELYNVEAIVIHLAIGQPTSLIGQILCKADVLLLHPLHDPRWEGMRSTDFNLKPHVQQVMLESPQASCFWPVLQHVAEGPVRQYLDEGFTHIDIIKIFDAGFLEPCFKARFQSDMDRIRKRDTTSDLKIADFIQTHHQSHKMFFTHNHPTMHVIGHMVDQFLVLLGHKSAGLDHCLSLDPNLDGGQNHFPETEYEWAYYGFTYRAIWKQAMGGRKFWHEQIRGIK